MPKISADDIIKHFQQIRGLSDEKARAVAPALGLSAGEMRQVREMPKPSEREIRTFYEQRAAQQQPRPQPLQPMERIVRDMRPGIAPRGYSQPQSEQELQQLRQRYGGIENARQGVMASGYTPSWQRPPMGANLIGTNADVGWGKKPIIPRRRDGYV